MCTIFIAHIIPGLKVCPPLVQIASVVVALALSLDPSTIRYSAGLQPEMNETFSDSFVASGMGAQWKGHGWIEKASALVSSRKNRHETTIPSAAEEQGATYYVAITGKDSNAGSIKAPWRTIQHAVDRWLPGDTVIVMDGQYLESVVNTRSGILKRRLHLVAQHRWAAAIKGDGVGILNQGNYVDIDGFEITQVDVAAEKGTGDGILSYGSYNRYRYNHVHDKHSPYGRDGFGGINLHGYNRAGWTQQGNEVSYNVIHDIGPLRNGCSLTDLKVQHGHGIYVSEKGALIYNNLIYTTGRSGINTWHGAQRLTIQNNTVVDALRDGILIGCGDEGCVSAHDDSVVSNNISVYNHSAGITEYGVSGAHNVYRNNLVYGNTINLRVANTPSVSGTVIADPQFVEYQPRVRGDLANFHLRPTSPAIHSGYPGDCPANDLEMVARPYGGVCDIGAFEAHGS